MTNLTRILVTGATGQLGTLVVQDLLKSVLPLQLSALVRSQNSDSATRLKDAGVDVRIGGYDDPDSLEKAFERIDRLLFISSNVVGADRVRQHRNVVTAARNADVGLVVYTSLLHADRSPLGLAKDHRETEAILAESGIPHVLLRNGWYNENHLAGVKATIESGVLRGAAADGRISSASRADYAAAAAAVLLAGKSYERPLELAGDGAYTLNDLASEIARQSRKPIRYDDRTPDEYETILRSAGMPDFVAKIVADADAGAARDALFDDGGTLSALIGRPTTPVFESLRAILLNDR
jgi:NAD(P)H dehydrogenase (quinone)